MKAWRPASNFNVQYVKTHRWVSCLHSVLGGVHQEVKWTHDTLVIVSLAVRITFQKELYNKKKVNFTFILCAIFRAVNIAQNRRVWRGRSLFARQLQEAQMVSWLKMANYNEVPSDFSKFTSTLTEAEQFNTKILCFQSELQKQQLFYVCDLTAAKGRRSITRCHNKEVFFFSPSNDINENHF